MRYLARGQATGITNPVLTFFGLDVSTGFLRDPESLTVQVFDTSSPEKTLEPVELLPETVVTSPARLGVGRWAPTWTPSSTGPVGEHTVRWRYTMPGGAEMVADEVFEVLPKLPFTLGPMYASIASMRAEELGEDNACAAIPDTRLAALLIMASRKIELVTQRFFEARYVTNRADGSRSAVQRYGEPIVAIESIVDSGSLVTASELVVYNRHLRGVLQPDDRSDPRVASTTWEFLEGAQNVVTAGVFGYTDAAPNSLWGVTPPAIAHATRLLAARWRDRAGSATPTTGPVMEERTRDQSVKYGPSVADGWAASGWTGDPEIDQVLVEYMRPAFMGFA